MPTYDEALRYMNCLALLLKIVSGTPGNFTEIYSNSNYGTLQTEMWNRLNAIWELDKVTFLAELESLIYEIQQISDQDCYIVALECAKWMDHKITYLVVADEKLEFSLWNLVPINKDNYFEIGALNDNYKECGIWINPKFDVYETFSQKDGCDFDKRITNRDIFEKANRQLHNCSYFCWNEGTEVENIILSKNLVINTGEKDKLVVGFAPMCDKPDVINRVGCNITRNGVKKNGVSVEVTEEDLMLDRLTRDWQLAAEEKIDILFFPELLGTTLSEQEKNGYNCIIQAMAVKNAIKKLDTVGMTILPTLWLNGENSATIVYRDGKILDKQKKYIPYVDEKNHVIEALKEQEIRKTTILHIPGAQRIAIVICAEFIDDANYVENFLCGNLGVTLLIVPSHTIGEQDFINKVASLKGYGTTVIWGNCCGAKPDAERAIGACSIAGKNSISIMGDECKCGGSCGMKQACVYRIIIPLRQYVTKLGSKNYDVSFEHIIR